MYYLIHTLMESPNYYQDYLDFKMAYDLEKDKNVIRAKTEGYYQSKDYDDEYLLGRFLTDVYGLDDNGYLNRTKYYDINYNIILNFPPESILELMKRNFETREICYNSVVHIELVKYIYHIWPQYDKPENSPVKNSGWISTIKNYLCGEPDEVELHHSELPYPHNEFARWIWTIKNHLIETANLSSKAYYDMMKNPANPKYNSKKHYIYYTWWLYVYYPLLPNGEELILKLIDFVYLDDAQDMLMYGIYQMEPARLNSFIKRFILALLNQETQYSARNRDRVCFHIIETGTGAYDDITTIFKKLYQHGYQILSDDDIREAFAKHGYFIDVVQKDIKKIKN